MSDNATPRADQAAPVRCEDAHNELDRLVQALGDGQPADWTGA